MELNEVVKLEHGAGGSAMRELIENVIASGLTLKRVGDGIGLEHMDDGAVIKLGNVNLVFTTDSHTVYPIFFPGGDIGRLAVSGTVNDLAVMGAKPIALACAMVIEEGFPLKDLKRIVKSMDETAREAGVAIVTGDTKVVERGKLDQIVITTTGVGIAEKVVLDSGLKPGDKIIVTGCIGAHGIALLAFREGIELEVQLKSDVAPIWPVVKEALKVGGVTAMKDPTRGGLASALNEMARKSRVDIIIEEEKLPIKDEVKAVAEMLGIDPLEVTCEGVAIIGVEDEYAEEVLKAVRKTAYGKNASIIGRVVKGEGLVIMESLVGGRRIVREPVGEPIPRVC